MTARYGYFRIEFYKSNGKSDTVAAKRVFKWCVEHYDWFYEDTCLPPIRRAVNDKTWAPPETAPRALNFIIP